MKQEELPFNKLRYGPNRICGDCLTAPIGSRCAIHKSALWAVAYEQNGRLLSISRDHRFSSRDAAEKFVRKEQHVWGKLPLRVVLEGKLER